MKRIFIPFVIISVFILTTFLLFPGIEGNMAEYLKSLPNGSTWIYVAISFIVLSSDFILPIPSSIVMFSNGWILGLWLGMLVSLSACIVSSLLAYQLGAFSESKVNRYYSPKEVDRAKIFINNYGDYSVILSRGIPIISEAVSFICGNSSFPIKRFFWANLLGYTPVCFAYVYLGSISSTKEVFMLTIIANIVIAGLFWLLRVKS